MKSLLLMSFAMLSFYSSISRAEIATTQEKVAFAQEALGQLLKSEGKELVQNSISIKGSHNPMVMASDAIGFASSGGISWGTQNMKTQLCRKVQSSPKGPVLNE